MANRKEQLAEYTARHLAEKRAEREREREHVGGYRLECANGGLAPACTECVACDVAMQIKAACDELRKAADGIDGTDTEKMILRAVEKIERTSVAR